METRQLLATFAQGDVFAAADTVVDWYKPTGTLVQVLQTSESSGFLTGMAFDKAGNLFVTDFSKNSILEFGPQGNFLKTFASGVSSAPESLAFDSSGNLFVGLASGGGDIRKYDAKGTLLATYKAAIENRGTDWIELAPDQHTIFYTSEGRTIKRFDTATNKQLADFATGLPNSAYAFRLLGDGSVLVADSAEVLHLNKNGQIIKHYTSPGSTDTQLFALNLDPDGKSFWTGDTTTGDVLRFDIASGAVLKQFKAQPGGGPGVFGLVIKGEIVQALSSDVAVTTTTPLVTGAVGTNQTLTFHVTNNGPSPASGVVLTDTLPSGLKFVPNIPGATVKNGVVIVPIGSLAKGASTTVTLTVTPTVAGTITNTVHVASSTKDGNLANNVATAQINAQTVPVPPTTGDGPLVVGLNRFGFHWHPTLLVIKFNEPLDPARAQDPNNYTILTSSGQRIAVSSAIYDPSTDTVSLNPTERLSLFKHYRLIVNGSTPTGVTDAAGRLLDGAGTGQPGSDYSADLFGFLGARKVVVEQQHHHRHSSERRDV